MTVMKKRVLGCVGLLLFACLALSTLCTARQLPKPRTPPVDMHDLMIDVSAFPQGWHTCAGPTPFRERQRGEKESLYVGLCPQGFRGVGGSLHEVYRYRNELDAAIAVYSDFSGGEFRPWDMITPWAVPEEWSYQSPVANRFKFLPASSSSLYLKRSCHVPPISCSKLSCQNSTYIDSISPRSRSGLGAGPTPKSHPS